MPNSPPDEPPQSHPPAETPRAFSAYVLRMGRYAGRRLAAVAAVDSAWVLSTFALADTDAVDTTAVRGYLNSYPPLVVGDGVVLGGRPFVTIARIVAPDETNDMEVTSQWHLRMTGGDAHVFPRLDAARAYGEQQCGVRTWVRVTNSVIVGEIPANTAPPAH